MSSGIPVAGHLDCAKLRNWKHHSGTPEHVEFAVKERTAWEELVKPYLLQVDRRRIPFESYKEEKRLAAEQDRAFCWVGVAPFEQMHPVCGHEYMLMGMGLDPDWVKDMVQTYTDFTIMHQEVLFEEEGVPYFVWYYEDMGFKERPFMSPSMYEELNRKILPVLKVGTGYILHSDHSIPPDVAYDTLCYFFDHGRRITERI